MNNDIKYKVKTIINTNEKNDKKLVETFNMKLLKLILLFERDNISNCQT